MGGRDLRDPRPLARVVPPGAPGKTTGSAPRVTRDVVVITIDTRGPIPWASAAVRGGPLRTSTGSRARPGFTGGARPQRDHPSLAPDILTACFPSSMGSGRTRASASRPGSTAPGRVEGEGLHLGRLRRGLRARLALRPRPRLRRLQRALPAPRRAVRILHPAGPRRGRREGRGRVVPGRAGQAPVPLGPSLRSARALRSALAVPRKDSPTTSTSARWPTRMRRSRRSWRSFARGEPASPRRRHGRSRRGPGRSRRAHARALLLRVDAARSARRLVPAAPPGRPGRRPGAAHRHSPDDPRRRRRADARGADRAVASAGRPQEAHEGSYFEALSAAFNRGWAPLRGMAARGDKYIDLPIPELYNLPTDPARRRISFPRSPMRCGGCASACELPRLARGGTIGSKEAAKLRSLGYLTGSGETKETYGRGRPENAHRRRPDAPQDHGAERSREVRRSASDGRKVVAENPKMKLGYTHLAMVLRCKGDIQESFAPSRALPETARAAREPTASERWCSGNGRPKEALAVLLPYRESDELETLNSLGIALTDAGRAQEALPVFARAIEIDPSNGDAYQNTGIALLKLDQPEDARKNLEHAVALGKRRVRAWNALGMASRGSAIPGRRSNAGRSASSSTRSSTTPSTTSAASPARWASGRPPGPRSSASSIPLRRAVRARPRGGPRRSRRHEAPGDLDRFRIPDLRFRLGLRLPG